MNDLNKGKLDWAFTHNKAVWANLVMLDGIERHLVTKHNVVEYAENPEIEIANDTDTLSVYKIQVRKYTRLVDLTTSDKKREELQRKLDNVKRIVKELENASIW